MERKVYRLYDIYDGMANRILIGEFDTMRDVRRAAKQWDEGETDGECSFRLYRLAADRKYYFVRNWTY